MATGKLKSIELSPERMRVLADVLLAPMAAGTLTTSEDSMVEDATMHLSDDDFVTHVRGELDRASQHRIKSHLATCDACTAELGRLTALNAVWTDGDAMRDIQRRVRRALGLPLELVQGAKPAWKPSFTISLSPLLRPAGAYGEGTGQDVSSIEFPVIQDGEIVSGLKGVMMRSDRDLYVSVTTKDAKSKLDFGDRKAFISISDAAREQPILQRKIDIGVTVLLGTDVRISGNSHMAVEMLPEPGS